LVGQAGREQEQLTQQAEPLVVYRLSGVIAGPSAAVAAKVPILEQPRVPLHVVVVAADSAAREDLVPLLPGRAVVPRS
jgi:hypothetical protein